MENKKVYNLIFISTFINESYIYKLIDSIVSNNNFISLYFVIVNQTASRLKFPESTVIDFCEINTEKLPLSKARNIGITHLLENNIYFDYIMFPDDDTTFDKDFFNEFNGVVVNNCNYLIDVFGQNTKDLYIENNIVEGQLIKTDKPKAVMSVNMLVNEKSFRKVGLFDEKMGVGAEYGAGEDTDLFLRCVALSGPFIYTKKLWNYHPKFEDKHKALSLKQLMRKYKNYGKGVIYLNVKHKQYLTALELCVSALGGSIAALLKFDVKLFVARLYAFFIRFYTLLVLITENKFDN